MGSKIGYYEYHYDFAPADIDDIANYQSILKPGLKAFVFLIKTDFVFKSRPGVPTPELKLDSETFYAHVYQQKDDDQAKSSWLLYLSICYRLSEYWMSFSEARLLATSALAFAHDMMSKDPQYDLVVPIVVRLRVCTLQQEHELFDSAWRRAIRENKLAPVYLRQEHALHDPPGKQITTKFKIFLKICVSKIRVENAALGLGLMEFCLLCKQEPALGDQITTLPPCNHAFHSHCLVRKLLEQVACPHCGCAISIDHYTD